jgi:hypothetical protein
LLIVVAGCTSESDKQMTNNLKQFGLAYLNYNDSMGAGPSKADDLAPFVENDQKLLNILKSGEIVLIYDVKLGPKEGADVVLGYVKDAPTKGGPVLMGDGKVVRMTADELKKAKMAKPAEKKEGK